MKKIMFLIIFVPFIVVAKVDVSKIYGKIKVVDSFPDYKIKFVDTFPDFKIKYVDSFPGVN